MRCQTFKIFLTALLVVVSCGCELVWERYQNREYGFSLLLPRPWNKEEGFQGIVAIIAYAPVKSNAKFRANINVVARELPEETPLDILFEMNKQEILQKLPGIKEDVSEGEVFAAKDKGKWLTFTTKVQDLTLKNTVVTWIKNRRAYVLNYIAEKNDFPLYEPFFKKAVQTFRIK